MKVTRLMDWRKLLGGGGLSLLGVVLSFTACAPKQALRVSPYETGRPLKADEWVYYLPQTVLDFGFCMEVRRFTPGPYAAYCNTLLGFPAKERAETPTYRIVEVSLGKHQEADLQAPYVVRQTGIPASNFVEMTRGGWLIPAAQPQESALTEQRAVHLPVVEFLDRSAEPFIDSQRSVLHAVQQHDSTFESVPVAREVAVKRTEAEKAQQAANVIFQLRKRRLDLLSGEEMPTSPDGLAVVLKELNRLEAEYLSLFRGVSQCDTIWTKLAFVPQRGAKTAILCRFAPSRGIVAAHEMTAQPLVLHLESDGEVAGVTAPPSSKNAYFYRSQRAVNVRLMRDNQMLYEGRVSLSQVGELLLRPIAQQ